ncbi:MAG: serine hydrolase [Desulfobacterales bacterium]|jgi:CubicO group peptidase (beta-lactamase class C family)
MKSPDLLMQQAVSENVFPGGVLLVAKNSDIVFIKAYGHANLFTGKEMTPETVFDLASLTKPLATTLAVMVLVQDKRLGLEQKLGSIIPSFANTEKEEIKIKHLLAHVSGLPDYRPYYLQLQELPEQDRKPALNQFLVAEPLLHPIGVHGLYSDLGFMVLQWVVESVCGQRLDRFTQERVYAPLGIKKLFYVDLAAGPPAFDFAATEQCPWRRLVLSGQVHDENAFAVGGIAGHAGLFGTAEEVYRLLSILLSVFHGRQAVANLQKNVLRLFLERHDFAARAFGFDSPDPHAASCGKYFSASSVGHLGFTGTSFWMDLERTVIVVLLTNRVHPKRDNDKIKTFRPELHNAVMQNLA